MPVWRLLGQALIGQRRTHHRQPHGIGHRQLTPGQAVVERADEGHDLRVFGEQLDILRALRRVVDALADIVLHDRLQSCAGFPVRRRPADHARVRDGQVDGVLRRDAVRRIVAAERQVGAQLDDTDGFCRRAGGNRTAGDQQPGRDQPRRRALHRTVAGLTRRMRPRMSVIQSDPYP